MGDREVFNVGHMKDIAIRELAALVKQHTRSESGVIHLELLLVAAGCAMPTPSPLARR